MPAGDSNQLWRLSGMGAELTGSIVGMGFLGWLIDRWQQTSPRWTLVLAGVGILGGGYNFIRSAMQVNKRAAQDYRSQHHGAARQDSGAAKPLPPISQRDHDDVRRGVEQLKADLKKLQDANEGRTGTRGSADPHDDAP